MDSHPSVGAVRVARFAAAIGLAAGVLGVLQWAVNLVPPRLVEVGWISVRPNTTLALLLLGAAFWPFAPGESRGGIRRAQRIAALLAGLLGFLTLVEYAAGVDLGIDRMLLVGPSPVRGSAHPGRVAPTTAATLVLLGLARGALDSSVAKVRLAAEAAGAAGGLIAGLTVVGYAFDVRALTVQTPIVKMALNTACGLLALSVGVIAQVPESRLVGVLTSPPPGGTIARRLLPALLVAILLFQWLGLRAVKAGLYGEEFSGAVQAVVVIGLVSGLLFWATSVLNRSEADRRRVGEQLRISSAYARGLIEAAIDPLMTISADGKITDVNLASEVATGVPRAELIGSDFIDYFTEPDRARAGYTAVYAQGSVRDYPLTIRHRDGSLRDVLYNATVYRDQGGAVQGVFAAARDVTALNEAQSALQREQKRFEDVLEGLPVFTLLLTPDYHVRYANRRFVEIFGDPGERRCHEALFGLSEPCPHCQSFVCLQTHERHQWEWESPDHHMYEIHDRPFTDVDGAELVLEMGIDVTERKQAEERLKASSTYARGLIEASLDPLLTISTDGKITDVNIATETVTGVPRSALIGSDFSDYFTEPARARAGYQAVFAQGMVRDYPLTIRHQSGITTDVLYNATVYRNASGDVEGVFAAARDITERERSEEEIRRLNRLYGVLSRAGQAMVRIQSQQALFDEACRIAVQVGGFRLAWVGQLDPATRLIRPVAVHGNPSDYPSSTRISADDVPEGRGPTGAAHREGRTFVCRDMDREPQMAPWRDMAAVAGLRSSAAFPLRVGGAVRAVFTVYSREIGRFADEEVRLLEELTSNIAYAMEALEREDQRRRAQEEARVLNETLERRVSERTAELAAANKELQAFAYSISHDLRAPLRSINGFSQALAEDCADRVGETGAGHLHRIQAATQRMGAMIDALLKLSRVTRSEMRREDVDLSALAADVVAELQRTNPERRVEVAIEPGLVTRGDRALTRTVLENLLGNAWKFTAPRDCARIEVGGARLDGRTAVRVRDNGVGFDMKYSEKLFAPFQRLHGPEFEGTGIGLATVQRIILRHGGQIVASAEADRGAEFTFTFE